MGSIAGIKRGRYKTSKSRFDPYKDIRIGLNSLEKRCSKDGKWYPLTQENFDRDYKRVYGYHSQCKHCQKKYQDEYRLKNPWVKGRYVYEPV